MGIKELFSKRQRRLRGEMPDVYSYDKLPDPFKVQVVHIVRDALGSDRYGYDYVSKVYENCHNALCREYGLFRLDERARSFDEALFSFFLHEQSVEKGLDVIEILFQAIDTWVRAYTSYSVKQKMGPEEAIEELNDRFKEHGVGFQFESGEVIRVDSQYLHAEAVKPVLAVLRGSDYKGANDEFLRAHEHYRRGRYKECMVEALKSLESTLKTICTKRRWPTRPTDTAKTLINICFAQGLLPPYLESQMGSLRSLLESGVPTVRNKLGGHGQGVDTVGVPGYMARYALNLTASSILFLVEAHAAKE